MSIQYAKIVQKLGFQAKFTEFKIQNIVGSCDVRFPIRLEGLAFSQSMFSSVSGPGGGWFRGGRHGERARLKGKAWVGGARVLTVHVLECEWPRVACSGEGGMRRLKCRAWLEVFSSVSAPNVGGGQV